MEKSQLAPVVILAGWTMVIWAWMYVTRIPAVGRANIKLDPEAPRGEQMSRLPAQVRWKADNYNHLMEQPTVFYAVAIVLVLVGHGGGWALRLAWAYVAIRIVHSLVQTTWNKIEVRFALFALSSLVLIGMVALAVHATLIA
ncbi:MAG: MAPEG family protein [Deltaproteobacteria bacterium]